MWDPNVVALAARYRVVRYDHPGHGESPAGPATIEGLAHETLGLADELGLERFVFCGLSLGGMVGMWLASHTDRVSRLALMCTTAWYPDKSLWDERIEVLRSRGMEPLADEIVSRWFTPAFSPAVVARFRAELLEVDVPTYIGCAEAIRDMDLRPGLAKIDVPVVVIAAGAGSFEPRRMIPTLRTIDSPSAETTGW